jgi:hypothetical protein
MREHPHLKLEREVQLLREALALEREGRAHNHRERQRLGEEVERESPDRLGDQRNFQRLERDLQELRQLLEERQQAVKVPKKGLWTTLLKKQQPLRSQRKLTQSQLNTLRYAKRGQRTCTLHRGQHRIARQQTESVSTYGGRSLGQGDHRSLH